MPFPPPGNLPHSGTELASLSLLHWQAGSLPLAPSGKPLTIVTMADMGELHFEARDGYFNRVMLNVQGKSFFLQSAVFYVNRECQKTTLANYLCDL